MSNASNNPMSQAVALDLILKTLMNSKDFVDTKNKNWAAIAGLIPGTTGNQCSQRFEELRSSITASDSSLRSDASTEAGKVPNGRGDSASKNLSKFVKGLLHESAASKSAQDERPKKEASGQPRSNSALPATTTGKDKSSQEIKDNNNKGSGQDSHHSHKSIHFVPVSPIDNSPNMVIHVCDEAKSLKEDFTCPRDLLVQEMRYFAEYLSVDSQRWEEVDISVHCDVQIFDWLIRYVKRNTAEGKKLPAPGLEPNNVISILISSDFLKMDSLVEKCIQYCHDNMTAIVSTPCNMNCINDRLISRITKLFDHNEADEIRDKKDKFKSKLFCKMIEKLFDGPTPDSPASASTVFRCHYCKRLLTQDLQQKLKCLPSRMSVDYKGSIVYSHSRDPGWDVNSFLIGLRQGVKSWREVYWRLWGSINYLYCSRCDSIFPCTELSHCLYHSDTSTFQMSMDGFAGMSVRSYSCCQQKALRFDPSNSSQGCTVRDHVVTLSQGESLAKQTRVLDDLLRHRDLICIPFTKPDKLPEINVFSVEEYMSGVYDRKGSGKTITASLEDNLPLPSTGDSSVDQAMAADEFSLGGDTDDEIGDEEAPGKAGVGGHINRGLPKVTGKKITQTSMEKDKPNSASIEVPNFKVPQHKWDPTKPLRWNQDSQREDDMLRTRGLVNYLTRLRVTASERQERAKSKEYAGGLFAKLDIQFRNSLQQPKASGPMASIRTKPRHGFIKLS